MGKRVDVITVTVIVEVPLKGSYYDEITDSIADLVYDVLPHEEWAVFTQIKEGVEEPHE